MKQSNSCNAAGITLNNIVVLKVKYEAQLPGK